jgi:hypothetical protein
MRRGLIIAGFALLAVVALAGWTRTPPTGATYFNNPAAALNPAGFTSPQGQPCVPNGVMPVAYGQPIVAGFGTPYGAPMYQSPYATPVIYTPAEPVRSERVIERRYVPQRNYVVRKRRSTGKSVAIVAGSAGLGAAIGALAGGGKGAAIGALAGGGGGFVYDRVTR